MHTAHCIIIIIIIISISLSPCESISLGANSVLTSLNLGHTAIGEVGVAAIAESLKGNAHLTELWLSENKITARGNNEIMTPPPLLEFNYDLSSPIGVLFFFFFPHTDYLLLSNTRVSIC